MAADKLSVRFIWYYKLQLFLFSQTFFAQNQIITVFQESNKHHQQQYKTGIISRLIMFPIDSWNWILFFWPRNGKTYQLMIKPLYGRGVHWILLARVKGQVGTNVSCGGGKIPARQGWFSKRSAKHSFHSYSLFYPTVWCWARSVSYVQPSVLSSWVPMSSSDVITHLQISIVLRLL